MKAFNIVILAICIIAILTQKDTDDPELNKIYKINKMKPGDGKNFPKKGDIVHVNYRLTLPGSNDEIDSSFGPGRQPLDFTLGQGAVIAGWEEMIEHMSLGEKLVFICPSEKGYGKRGAGHVIPPNSDLEFTVELMQINSLRKKDEL